jgi:hypothetical protein
MTTSMIRTANQILAEIAASEIGDDDPDRLISTTEAAVIFGRTPDTVRWWAQSGRLASTRTKSGAWRFRLADVVAKKRGRHCITCCCGDDAP